jgi:hypothetical protein
VVPEQEQRQRPRAFLLLIQRPRRLQSGADAPGQTGSAATQPFGAVPEIVAHERTGLVASSIDELVDAVKRVHRLDRRECGREVKERFSASRMATDYERVYRQLIEASRAAD